MRETLLAVCQDLKEQNNKISKEDFNCPNHYAKLAFQAGENKAYDLLASLLK